MPVTAVVFYCEDDGTYPLLEWREELPPRAKAECLVRIERLRELEHDLRRPEADYLRDDIYELRASLQGIPYRILYFFHGKVAAVLSHGVIKGQRVPAKAINEAVEWKRKFAQDPQRHTYESSVESSELGGSPERKEKRRLTHHA